MGLVRLICCGNRLPRVTRKLMDGFIVDCESKSSIDVWKIKHRDMCEMVSKIMRLFLIDYFIDELHQFPSRVSKKPKPKTKMDSPVNGLEQNKKGRRLELNQERHHRTTRALLWYAHRCTYIDTCLKIQQKLVISETYICAVFKCKFVTTEFKFWLQHSL